MNRTDRAIEPRFLVASFSIISPSIIAYLLLFRDYSFVGFFFSVIGISKLVKLRVGVPQFEAKVLREFFEATDTVAVSGSEALQDLFWRSGTIINGHTRKIQIWGTIITL